MWSRYLNSNLYVVDEANKKMKFFYSNNAFENFVYSVSEEYDFRDILESEVLIDGETISKTSRGSQIGGALLEGVLAGGVGVIRGLSSPTTTKDTISSIQLRLTVKNIKEPIRQIKLFQSEFPLSKDHETIKF